MSGVDIQVRVGQVFAADGGAQIARGTRGGALVSQDEHARYAEALLRGQVFSACTGVAGVAPGTALSSTPPFVLWNPPSSNRVAVIGSLLFGFISGTLGAGTLALAGLAQNSQPTGGTVLVPSCGLVGASAVPTCKVFQGSTLVGTPAIVRPAFNIGATPASPAIIRDDTQGEIGLYPGSALCLQGIAAAGTSPLVLLGMVWEEAQIL